MGDVTPARANVLVTFARKAGHFTTGGRGVNAPDMAPRDAATALLLALQMEVPSDAVAAMLDLRGLPLWFVSVDPGDGTFRDVPAERFFPYVEPSERPPRMGALTDCATLDAALVSLLTPRDEPHQFHEFDRVSLHRSGASRRVELELYEPGWNRGWQEGPKAWRLTFWNHGSAGSGVWRTMTICAEHLQRLAEMIAGEGDR